MSGPDPAPHPSPRIRRHPGRGPPPCAAARAPRPRARAQALLARPIPGPRVPGRTRVGVGSRARRGGRWGGGATATSSGPGPRPGAGCAAQTRRPLPLRGPGGRREVTRCSLALAALRRAGRRRRRAGRSPQPRPAADPRLPRATAAATRPAGAARLAPFLAWVPGRPQASPAARECPAPGYELGVPGWGVGISRPKQPASFVIREPDASKTWNFRSGWSWAPWSQVDTPHLPTPGLRMPRTCRPHCGLILNRGGE